MTSLTECTGGHSCCTTTNKCGKDEGDCDNDSDCKEGLKCGRKNCSQKYGLQWDRFDDCCYKPGKKLFALVAQDASLYMYCIKQ